MSEGHAISLEAQRLLALPAARARSEFGDRVARTFLLSEPEMLSEFWQALAFNAHLVTEIRLLAQQRHVATIWETP